MLTTSDKITVNLGTPRERREVFPFQVNVATGMDNFQTKYATVTEALNCLRATVNEFNSTAAYLTNAYINVATVATFILSSVGKPAAKSSTAQSAGVLKYDVGTSCLYLSVATNKWVRVALASWS